MIRNDNLTDRQTIPEYDCLRVIATLMVVLGHCTYYKIDSLYGGCDYSIFVGNGCVMLHLFQKVTRLLYLFHMPLFMTLSGALFSRSIGRKKYNSIQQLAEDKGKRLIIPFFAAGICYSFPLKYISGYYSNSDNVLKDFFVGQLCLQGNNHLWYCAVLFTIFILTYILEKRLKGKATVKILVMVVASMLSSIYEIKLALLSYIFQYMVWFYFGLCFESIRERVNKKIECKWFIVETAIATVLLLTVYLVVNNYENLIWKATTSILKIVFTAALCLDVYNAAYMFAKTRARSIGLFKTLKNNSFGIYLYSDPLNYVFLSVATIAFQNKLFISNAGATLFYAIRFAGTLVISVAVTEALRKLRLRYLY